MLSESLDIFMDECRVPARAQVFSKSADNSKSRPYSIARASRTSVFRWRSITLVRSVTLFEPQHLPKVHHTFCGALDIT